MIYDNQLTILLLAGSSIAHSLRIMLLCPYSSSAVSKQVQSAISLCRVLDLSCSGFHLAQDLDLLPCLCPKGNRSIDQASVRVHHKQVPH